MSLDHAPSSNRILAELGKSEDKSGASPFAHAIADANHIAIFGRHRCGVQVQVRVLSKEVCVAECEYDDSSSTGWSSQKLSTKVLHNWSRRPGRLPVLPQSPVQGCTDSDSARRLFPCLSSLLSLSSRALLLNLSAPVGVWVPSPRALHIPALHCNQD